MAGDGLGTGPEGATPDELVLRDFCENNVEGRPSAEDADRAIAKALQDQERAFMLLNAYGGENGWEEDESDEESDEDDEDDEEGWVEDDGAAEGDASGEESAQEEQEDDAALARRLQEAEDREHYRRLLELTGADGIEEYNEDDEDGYMTDDSVDIDNMTYEELQALGEAVGTVSRGVPQDIIDALPNAKYTSRFSDAHPPTGSEEEEQCAVCRMEFEAGEDVRLLPCSHVYHPDCIGQWLHINKVCPICSKEVTEAARKAETKPKAVLEPRNK